MSDSRTYGIHVERMNDTDSGIEMRAFVNMGDWEVEVWVTDGIFGRTVEVSAEGHRLVDVEIRADGPHQRNRHGRV